MTQEEKAKRYDEIREKARKEYFIHEANNAIGIMDALERVFPELKESEDERIRKEIIDFATKVKNGLTSILVNNYDFNKWIAWLEKLGEQKSLDDIAKEVTKNKETAISFLKSCGIMNANGVLADEYKIEQGEKNPVDKVEPKFKVGDTIQPKDRGHEPWQIMQVDILDKKYRFKDGYVIHFSQEDNYELVEQKPSWKECDLSCFESALYSAFSDIWQSYLLGEEVNVEQWTKEHSKELLETAKEELKDQTTAWNEEDKAMINNLYQVIDDHIVISGDTRRMFCSWLESLKDRVQPKQEWSEEDLMLREEIINLLQKHGMNKEVDWLKSLRPQSHWKPSDEQMHYLSWIANIKVSDSVVEQEVSKHLNELLEDLKKLREE